MARQRGGALIAFLRGKIQDVQADHLIIDVGGVGYELLCPINVIGEFVGRRGQAAEFWISTQVREDAITLFGFSTPAQKQLFTTFLKVNGVGPKMALNILSGASREELVRLIETEDAKGLSKLPKVGKKTAEQIILTLKGKLVHATDGEGELLPPISGTNAEIMSALVNLGFKPADVEKTVNDLPKDTKFEDGVRQGLSRLTSITSL